MANTNKFEAAKRRRNLRERAVAKLGGCCTICGYNKTVAALDFHHMDPMIKDFTVSSRMTSWAAIEREIAKCILLCANCHREVHEGLHPGYLEDEWSFPSSQLDIDWDADENLAEPV